MAFQEQDSVSIPGSGELVRWTVPISGGTLHVVGSRASDGSSRAISTTFQASGISSAAHQVEVEDSVGIEFTPEEVLAGIINRSGTTDAFSDTLPSAADWQEAWAGGTVGSSYLLSLRNQTAFLQTLEDGTGTSVQTGIGTTSIPPTSCATFLVVWGDDGGVALYPIAISPIQLFAKITQNTMNATTGALDPALLTGAEQVFLLSTNSTPGAQQMPAASDLLNTSPGAYPGSAWRLRIMNSGAGTLTVTADEDDTVTLVGAMTVPTNKFRDFILELTDNDPTWTATLTSVGHGDYS